MSSMRHARDSNRRWPAVTEVHTGIRLGRDATFKGFSYAWPPRDQVPHSGAAGPRLALSVSVLEGG
jgi:hypothetical protein